MSPAQIEGFNRRRLFCPILMSLHVSSTLATKSRSNVAMGFLDPNHETSAPAGATTSFVKGQVMSPSSEDFAAAFVNSNASTLGAITSFMIVIDILVLAVWMRKSKKDEIVDFEYEDQRYYGRLCEIVTELAGMLKTAVRMQTTAVRMQPLNEQVFIAVIPIGEQLQQRKNLKDTFHAWRKGSLAWWTCEADFENGLEALSHVRIASISDVVVKKDTVRMKKSGEEEDGCFAEVVFPSAKSAQLWGSTLVALIEQFSDEFLDGQTGGE